MYRCASCGGNHRKTETARACAEAAARRGMRWGKVKPDLRVQDTRTGRERSYDFWATSATGGLEEDDLEEEGAPIVPNGHYFLLPEHWSPNGLHVWFRSFAEGRWKNVWFITAYESDGKPALVHTISDREYVYSKLVAAGPAACMAEYGRVYSRCGVCNEEISLPEREDTGGHEKCFQSVFDTARV